MAADLQAIAERALRRLGGFDQAQASAGLAELTELNIENNQVALLRTTSTLRVQLVGILGGRRASTEISDASDEAIAAAVDELQQDAQSAPADGAHAVSADQRATIVQGPQKPDTAMLADKAAELLAWRTAQTPTVQIKQAVVAHTLQRSCLVTSEGSAISCTVGCHELSVGFNAVEGERSSSFNFAGGRTDDLAAAPAADQFGIGELMHDAARSVLPRPLAAIRPPFTGDVLLTPPAAASLLQWLLGQLADDRLLSGTSLYRERVGQAIASPLLTLASRFDAPGTAAVSADGHLARAVTLVERGRLLTLIPNRYTSRKTGLAHVPVAAAGGWQVSAGDAPWRSIAADVPQGALVARLSMGMPAANGDFAGVIKNSFLVEDGQIGTALAETMISGNVAQMLQSLRASSQERIDNGDWLLPWMCVGGLRFS